MSDEFHDPEYRIVYECVAEDGTVEFYDAHNDLLGWHRSDVKPFGADDPQAPIPTRTSIGIRNKASTRLGSPYPKAEEPQ